MDWNILLPFQNLLFSLLGVSAKYLVIFAGLLLLFWLVRFYVVQWKRFEKKEPVSVPALIAKTLGTVFAIAILGQLALYSPKKTIAHQGDYRDKERQEQVVTVPKVPLKQFDVQKSFKERTEELEKQREKQKENLSIK